MKKSINAWSFPREYTFTECIDAAVAAGFDAIEFNLDAQNIGHSFTVDTTDEEILAVKALCDAAGIKVISISSSLHNCRWSVSAPDEVAYIHRVLDRQLNVAKIFGADTILVVPGGMPEGMLLSESRKNSINNLKAALPIIEKYGITVGVENIINGFFLSPYDVLSFINEINSPLVAAYLDLGNMIAFSAAEHWCDVLAGRIAKIHIKDNERLDDVRGRRICKLLEGSVNYPRVMAILKSQGFDGYLTAEVSNLDKKPIPEFLASVSAAESIIIGYYNEA